MIELTERTALEGLLPMEIGGMRLSEVAPGPLTALRPYKGRIGALSEALETAHGFGWPEPGRITGTAECGAIWFGRAQAMLVGVAPKPELADHAAVVDQSDAWAIADLIGAGTAQVLARLTPVDLRPKVFSEGHTLRSEFARMPASITRTGAESFRIMVFRAFARTLVHEAAISMEGVAARRVG